MKTKLFSWLGVCTCLLLVSNSCFAQDEKEAEDAPKPIVKLHYFNNNNQLQYLILESQLKINKVLSPQANKTYSLYLDSADKSNLVANLKTDERGKAKTFISPSLKEKWDASSSHTFILKEADEDIITDFTINKAKISIDTVNNEGTRSITVTVSQLQGEDWEPVPDVEMKIGIVRMGGILSAGDEDTYTTDSTGSATLDLTKLQMPGDKKGNYVIAARVDDHETLGNLLFEKTVPWGQKTIAQTGFFNQRTLWSTRFRTPYWLLFMAYSIVIGVWGSLIYLIFQLIKIKKLGSEKEGPQTAILPDTPVSPMG